MKIEFEKCHGLENDYLFINLFEHDPLPENDLPRIARRMSHRKRGPGADGIVLYGPSATAAARMRIFNADGSEAQICGNALRCIARILHEDERTASREFKIETRAGLIPVHIITSSPLPYLIELDMGSAHWERSAIPMTGFGEAVSITLSLDGNRFQATCLSVGNPHCVIFDRESWMDDLSRIGPRIETMAIFPERINVEMCDVRNRGHMRVDVWERGSGITSACGTGATAAFAAGRRLNLIDPICTIELPGGCLELSESEGIIRMKGPATRVYSGICDLSERHPDNA